MDLSSYASTLGLHIYDSELVRENDHLIYRIYITKPGGVTLDDCEEFSRLISPILDVNEPTKDEYFLEVSSPGIERALKNPSHFKSSCGELIKIKIKDEESKIAKLISADDEKISIQEQLQPSKPGAKVSAKRQAEQEIISVEYGAITRARTYVAW